MYIYKYILEASGRRPLNIDNKIVTILNNNNSLIASSLFLKEISYVWAMTQLFSKLLLFDYKTPGALV